PIITLDRPGQTLRTGTTELVLTPTLPRRGREVQPHLVRDEVRVRNDERCDLALRPGAPVVGPHEERVERFTPRCPRVVPLEERKPIGEARLPSNAELVAALNRPSSGIEEAAVVLARVLGLEGKAWQTGERGG